MKLRTLLRNPNGWDATDVILLFAVGLLIAAMFVRLGGCAPCDGRYVDAWTDPDTLARQRAIRGRAVDARNAVGVVIEGTEAAQ